MFIDTIIRDPEEILPIDLLKKIEGLAHGESKLVESIIAQTKNVQDEEIRIYALLLIYELSDIRVEDKQKVFAAFVNDTNKDIQYHMVLFTGIYKIVDSIPALQQIVKKPNELVQCTAFWSLAKLGQHKGLFDQITEILPKAQDDRAISLLASALYLLNSDGESREMLFLKDYFLANYYDADEGQFLDVVFQRTDFSPELIGYLLWQAGFKYVEFHNWDSLGLNWLIS